MLVADSPGLDELASGLLHTKLGDFPVELGLRRQRFWSGIAEPDIEFGDRELVVQLGKSLEVLAKDSSFAGLSNFRLMWVWNPMPSSGTPRFLKSAAMA